VSESLDPVSERRLAAALSWVAREAAKIAAEARAVRVHRTLRIEVVIDERGQIGRHAVRLTRDHYPVAEEGS
jgi:hypothetical protein